MALPLQLSVVSAVHTGTATASKSHCWKHTNEGVYTSCWKIWYNYLM